MKIAQIATAIAIIIIIIAILLPKSNSSVNLKGVHGRTTNTKKAPETRRDRIRREKRTGQRAGDYKWTKTGYPVQTEGSSSYCLASDGRFCSGDVDCTNCNPYYMEPMTEAECRKATEAFRGNKYKVGSWGVLASGCIKRMKYPHFYYNTANHDVSCGNHSGYACVIKDPPFQKSVWAGM